MKTMRLGKTNLMISTIGLGGIPLTRPTEEEAVRAIQRCIDLGVNLIDTAVTYGRGMSERRIGRAVAHCREQIIIATKTPPLDKQSCLKMLELSLRNLNTDHIDLWQLHNVANLERYDEVMKPGGSFEAVQEALRAGKVRHVGFSSHNLDIAKKMVSSELFETVMVPFNFISPEAADELLPLARQLDIGFIAMKPFSGGRIKKASLAIKYLLQFEGVVPIPGIEKAEEMEQILSIVNGARELTSEEYQEIEEIRARVGKRFCRQCEYCMPCEQGVHIPALMYLPILWELWPREWFFSWSYVTDAVESVKNCTKCGNCEEKCPYHLPIRKIS